MNNLIFSHFVDGKTILTDVHHFCLVNLRKNQERTKFKLSQKEKYAYIDLKNRYLLEKRYLSSDLYLSQKLHTISSLM